MSCVRSIAVRTLARVFVANILNLTERERTLVLLRPDVAEAFPSEEAVNEALRSLIVIARKSTRLTKRSTGRGKKLPAG